MKAIHDQVKKRLAITRPPNPILPTYMLKHFVQHPNKLNGSWDALQKPLDGLGCTFWETIWVAVWTREEFDEATEHRYVGEELPAFQWGESHKQDQAQLTAVIEKAEILCRLDNDGVPERLRIWEGFHPTAIVTQDRVGAVRRILESSLTAAKQWSECDATIFPASLSQMTAAGARRLASTLPGSLAESWQQPLASGVAAGHPLSDYEEYLSAMNTWHAHAQSQAELLAEKPDLTHAELADAFASTFEIAKKFSCLATFNYAGLRRAAEQLRELRDLAVRCTQLAEKIAKAFGLSGAPPTMADDSVLTRITRLWAELGRGDDCCLADCLASATTGEKLDAAEAEAKSLMHDQQELESWFRLRDAPPIDQIARIRQTLSTAQGTWRTVVALWRSRTRKRDTSVPSLKAGTQRRCPV